MIRPVNFGFNPETAVNNFFQIAGHNESAQTKALLEFDNLVRTLTAHGIDVTIIEDTTEPFTPDSIFPNNWISFHNTKGSNIVCLYPMYAQNRRAERKPHILKMLKDKFIVSDIKDFSAFENRSVYLEGTGSMVLDRENKIVYACLSSRTDLAMLDVVSRELQLKLVVFNAKDLSGKTIYHTNVMMSIADKYAIVCIDALYNQRERIIISNSIRETGKELIEISLEQVNNFAGNMLQVNNTRGEKFLVMSDTAFSSLSKEQINRIQKYNEIIHSDINTIEKNGGGSARCMMAEVFLDKK
jgi:hypothetical protein